MKYEDALEPSPLLRGPGLFGAGGHGTSSGHVSLVPLPVGVVEFAPDISDHRNLLKRTYTTPTNKHKTYCKRSNSSKSKVCDC